MHNHRRANEWVRKHTYPQKIARFSKQRKSKRYLELGVILLSLLGAAEICLNHNVLYYHPDSVNIIIEKKFKYLRPSYKNILFSMLERSYETGKRIKYFDRFG